MRALVVDDNEINRVLLRTFLEALDIEVIEAINGRLGVDSARENLPDVILMDLKMPVMDGIEATAALKNLDLTANIPIIALSAHDEGANQYVAALASGCVACLPKPLNFLNLREALANHVGQLPTGSRGMMR